MKNWSLKSNSATRQKNGENDKNSNETFLRNFKHCVLRRRLLYPFLAKEWLARLWFNNTRLIFVFYFQHGNTALHEAAWKGFSQTVQILCKWKANAYIKNRGGFAPLHLCCQNGHNETCRVLLLAGCKPDIKNNVRFKSWWTSHFHFSNIFNWKLVKTLLWIFALKTKPLNFRA